MAPRVIARLWIVRHGDTFRPDEPPRRIGAATDLPLTPGGRARAQALAARFAAEGVRFDHAFAARLVRSRETAAILLGGTAAAVLPLLDEIDHGPDEDRPEAEVVARIGAAAIAAWDRDAVAPPGWTVDREARLAGWRDLLAGAAGDTLLVTSNGAARFALLADAGLARAAAALPSLKLRTAAYGRIDRGPDGWRIAAWDVRG